MFKEKTFVIVARSCIARPTDSVAGVINEAIGRHLIVFDLADALNASVLCGFVPCD